jgi:hypothetical protein
MGDGDDDVLAFFVMLGVRVLDFGLERSTLPSSALIMDKGRPSA